MSKMPETAYKNLDFLNSTSARTIRILSEYLEPKNRLQREKVKDTIVFFGSARFCDAETAGRRAAEANTADEVRQAKRLQAAGATHVARFTSNQGLTSAQQHIDASRAFAEAYRKA